MSTQTLDSLDAAAWTDGKRYLWLLSPLVPVLALIGLGLHQSLGWGAFTWSGVCLLYTSPSPRDKRQSRMPSSA